MEISDEKILEIYMVCPKEEEDTYASRDRNTFLITESDTTDGNFELDGNTVSSNEWNLGRHKLALIFQIIPKPVLL